jgi:isopentenyldiphosphate isomerase
MTMELIDLIDDEGRTIGVVTRQEMRARRLPHRSTYVLVFDRQGRMFVHLRTPTKDVYPSHWDVTIGGVMLAGESWEQGVAREIREELGIDATAELLFPFRYQDPSVVVHGMVYRLVHDGPFQLQAEEIVRGEFMTPAQLDAWVARESFCPDGLQVLAGYRRQNVTA